MNSDQWRRFSALQYEPELLDPDVRYLDTSPDRMPVPDVADDWRAGAVVAGTHRYREARA